MNKLIYLNVVVVTRNMSISIVYEIFFVNKYILILKTMVLSEILEVITIRIYAAVADLHDTVVHYSIDLTIGTELVYLILL